MSTDKIRDSRRTYDRDELSDVAALADPFDQSTKWLSEATACEELVEPNAVTVATVDANGRPSARVVLLRGFDRGGAVFFTNYESRKGREIEATQCAALLFYWDKLERELRIEGRVERLSPDESDAYFARRPRGHRLSAWASPQSRVVTNRDVVEAAMHEADARFPEDVPRPPYWGGYRVVPEYFEFWQGRPSRVHDRIEYRLEAGAWTKQRLAP